jgi:hypothetical protein
MANCNPKNVTVGDIMRFYKIERDGSASILSSIASYSQPTYWTDDNDNRIPAGTHCVVLKYEWIESTDYVGYDFELLLPNGIITRGWGEYAVEPVWSQKKSRRKWYKTMSHF